MLSHDVFNLDDNEGLRRIDDAIRRCKHDWAKMFPVLITTRHNPIDFKHLRIKDYNNVLTYWQFFNPYKGPGTCHNYLVDVYDLKLWIFTLRQLTEWLLTDQTNHFQNWRPFKNLNCSIIQSFILVSIIYAFCSFSIIGHSFPVFWSILLSKF